MASPRPLQIDVAELDIQQLADVRTQLEEDVTHLTGSFAQLKQAQSKFRSCLDSVGEVRPRNADTTILVPLTSSLYVPGRLSDAEHVVVDIGTGYYVKKTRAEATAYYKAKVDFLHTSLETLSDTLQKKQDNMNVLTSVMQSKIQAQGAPKSAS